MAADDYEVTSDDAQNWADRVQEESSKTDFEGSGTQEAQTKYQDNAGDAGDAYAAGVAAYIGEDASSVTVDGDYEDGASEAGSDWANGISGAGERWAGGVQGKQDEYQENANARAQAWFSNYAAGVQGENGTD